LGDNVTGVEGLVKRVEKEEIETGAGGYWPIEGQDDGTAVRLSDVVNRL
jgi:hypothetical protein